MRADLVRWRGLPVTLTIILLSHSAVLVDLFLLDDQHSCTTFIPGTRTMSLGVDVNSVDLLPSCPGCVTATGFKAPVVELTCGSGKSLSLPYGVYQEFDQITAIPMTGGSQQDFVSFYKSSSEVNSRFSVNVGLEADVLKVFSFSASASYKWMRSTTRKQENYFSELRYTENVLTATMSIPQTLSLTSDAQTVLDQITMPAGDQDLQDVQVLQPFFKFIDQFGTHYFHKAYFGGVYQVTVSISKSDFDKSSSHEVSTALQACAGFSKIGGCANLNVDGGIAKKFQEINQNSQSTKRYFGGSVNLNTHPELWHDSISKSPAVIKGELKPISDLIKDPRKKALMEKAVEQRVLREYVNNFYTDHKTPSSTMLVYNQLKQNMSNNLLLSVDQVGLLKEYCEVYRCATAQPTLPAKTSAWINVYTSSTPRLYAGTDDTAHIIVYGSRGSTGTLTLKPVNGFGKGTRQDFTKEIKDIGEPTSVNVWRDGRDRWKLSWLQVHVHNTKYCFAADLWIEDGHSKTLHRANC